MRRGIRLKGIIYRRNADGSLRIYERTTMTRLPNLPENHPDFLAAYTAAKGQRPKRKPLDADGTLGALVTSYEASRAFRDLAIATRENRRRIAAKILDAGEGRGRGLAVKGLRQHHVANDIAPLTAHAAISRLKVWRALIKHARALGWVTEDPTLGIERPKVKTEGHHTWTADEIATFREGHPTGSDARLAFELIYWTGCRRSDAVTLGRQMIARDGWLSFKARKNGAEVAIPVLCPLPAWAAALEPDRTALTGCIEAMPARLTFIATLQGAPRSAKAFGSWFAAHCYAAKLPGRCTAHGLRKARAAQLAEIGATEHQIGAWIGDTSLSEIVRYTRKANRRRVLEQGEQRTKTGTSANPRSKIGG